MKPKPSASTLFLFLLNGRESFETPLPDAFALEAEQFRGMMETYLRGGVHE